MLERGFYYKIHSKTNELFEGIYLGSYYKVSSSNEKVIKNYDFLTKEGLFISKNQEDIYKAVKSKTLIEESLRLLIDKYEKLYLKNLENMFLLNKIKKETQTIEKELLSLSNEIKIANNHYSLSDLMKVNWINIDNVYCEYNLINDKFTMNCTFDHKINHNNINNIILDCFKVVINKDEHISKNIYYKIKNEDMANKLYAFNINNEFVNSINQDLKYFSLNINENFAKVSIDDKAVHINNLVKIDFDKIDYTHEEYEKLREDLNSVLEKINNCLILKLEEVKMKVEEVVYGAEQEMEYEKESYFGFVDNFKFNINYEPLSMCIC